MGLYRIYMLDAHGHVAAPPNLIECDSDQEAVHHARQYFDGMPVEVWRDAKRIERINPEK